MSPGARFFWFFMAGFCLAGLIVNLSPGTYELWPLRLVLAIVTLAIPTAGHWLMARYRIRIERRVDTGGQEGGR